MQAGETFFIAGLGLMGGSYAMGLSKQGYRVLATDKDVNALQWAMQRGIIAEGAPAQDMPKVAAMLGQADYIVLALYPAHIVDWLRAHKTFFKKGVLLTDLAGVKSCFVAEAQALLASEYEFIPSHPMAGKEANGVQNADDSVFARANFILTPTEKNTPNGIEFAQELAKTLRFARVTQLTVEEHDQIIGYVSQLTHAIAVSLMNANADPRLPDVTGDSFRDLTRIADINAELWSELFLANSAALVQEIDDFQAQLTELKQKLAVGDKEGLMHLFQKSTTRRRQFNQK